MINYFRHYPLYLKTKEFLISYQFKGVQWLCPPKSNLKENFLLSSDHASMKPDS